MLYNELDVKIKQQRLQNEDLELMIMGTLEGIYPNYPWICTIQDGETRRGKFKTAYIFNGYITNNIANGGTAGITMNLGIYKSYDEIYKFLRTQGGELLERANLPRAGKPEYIAYFIAQAEKDFGRTSGLINNFDGS